MGGSSSQVVGYRYYAKFAAFIGNRIEKFIGINFDNRGWIVKDQDDASSILNIDKPYLYGENEGGVYGDIEIYNGTPDQQPSATYQEYFPLVSGYPYQSYLVFHSGSDNKGFYLGNSGYMKEMLLWVKRTRVRNDGRGQWHDSKAEIPEIYYISSGESYLPLSVSMETICYWTGLGWDNTPIVGKANVENFTFPMYEKETSYQVKFLGNGELDDGDPVGALPSVIAAADFISSKGMIGIGGGTALPPVRWQLNKLPYFDNYGRYSIIRRYKGEGKFYWAGGIFDYRCVTSSNGASMQISKDGADLVNIGSWDIERDWLYREGKLDLAAGIYEVKFNVGERYASYSSPRPLIHFVVKQGNALIVPGGDINPIHKIREILTDDTAMNKPESDVNDINFIKAADRIWDEGLGISWSITEKPCLEAIEELCYHIEAGIRVNRQTGLYEVVLFRDDWFAEDEIHDISENKIKDLSLEVMNSDDIVNQLNVTYYDRERIKNSTFSVYENGSILTMGHANAESVEFPYFMNMRNAEIVANWKLKQFSTPAWSGSFTTGWKEARKWNRYDLIRLPWSKKWNGTILVRIMKINLGNGVNNTVTIDFEEVIPYSGEMNTSIVVDEPMNEGVIPPQPSMNVVFEAPYYLTALRAGQTNADLELSNNPDIGYVAAIAAKPQNNSLNALLYTDGGVGEFEQVSRLDYCDILQLDQPIIETSSSFTVTGLLTQTTNSSNLILLNDELMRFVNFDNETKVLTVKRGVLDTVPKKHNSGDLFVFDLPDVAFDSTQYVQSEIVEAQVLTTTPSGLQDLLETGQSIEIKSRAIRPYPPANVKINSLYFPEEVSGNPVLTWVNRSRSQQTGGDILGWFEGGVTLESGVTYQLIVIMIDASNIETEFLNVNVGTVNTYTVDLSAAPSSAKQFKIILKSVRDSYESMQHFEHIFVRPLTAPTDLTATYNA